MKRRDFLLATTAMLLAAPTAPHAAQLPQVAEAAEALNARIAAARARLGYDHALQTAYAEPAQYFPWRNVQQFPNFPNFPNFSNMNFPNFPNFPNWPNWRNF